MFAQPLPHLKDGRLLRRRRAWCLERLPSMSFDQHRQFRWLMPVASDDQRLDDVVWYCDGSMLNGRWKAVRATEFGIAVVSDQVDLLMDLAAHLRGAPRLRRLKSGRFRSSPCAPLRRRWIAWSSFRWRSQAALLPRITPDRWPESGVASPMSWGMAWLVWCWSKSLCGSLLTSRPLPLARLSSATAIGCRVMIGGLTDWLAC